MPVSCTEEDQTGQKLQFDADMDEELFSDSKILKRSEFVKTPQEVRDFIEKKRAGEDYKDDIMDPFHMPTVRVAKRLGIDTDGRPYPDIHNQIETVLDNLETWEDVDEIDTDVSQVAEGLEGGNSPIFDDLERIH